MAGPWDNIGQDAEVLKPAPTNPATSQPVPPLGASNVWASTGSSAEVIPAPQQQPGFFEGTTPMGTMGAITRGAAPYAAAAGFGALMGSPGGKLGRATGAVIAPAILGIAQMLGDPLVDAVNLAFPGANISHPTDGIKFLLDQAHVANAGSGFERTLQAGTSGLTSGMGMTNLGQTLVKSGAPLANDFVRGIGTALSDRPLPQALSGVAGGSAGQVAAENGLPPWQQALIGLGAGGLVAGAGALRTKAQIRPGSFNPTEGFVPNASMTDV